MAASMIPAFTAMRTAEAFFLLPMDASDNAWLIFPPLDYADSRKNRLFSLTQDFWNNPDTKNIDMEEIEF